MPNNSVCKEPEVEYSEYENIVFNHLLLEDVTLKKVIRYLAPRSQQAQNGKIVQDCHSTFQI